MKAKFLGRTAALALLLGFSASPVFAQLPTTCSDALLHGNYGVTVDGKIIPPGQTQFVAQQGVAMQHFDGAGNFMQVDFIMTNGVPAINPATDVNPNGFRANESGTYTVNSDCTGSATLTQYTNTDAKAAVIQIKFVLDQGGKEFRQVVESITVFLPPPACENLGQAPGCSVNVPATILANGRKLGSIEGNGD